MPKALSQQQADFITGLKTAGVLEEFRDGTLGCTDTFIIACSDGHHFSDLFTHHRKVCGDNQEAMHHVICLNGGALLLPKLSPLRKDGNGYKLDDEVILNHLRGAIGLKGLHPIVLYAHAPCGAAGLAGIDLRQQFDLLAEAKHRVRDYLKNEIVEVRAVFHVYYGERRRSYFFHRDRWNDYSKEAA